MAAVQVEQENEESREENIEAKLATRTPLPRLGLLLRSPFYSLLSTLFSLLPRFPVVSVVSTLVRPIVSNRMDAGKTPVVGLGAGR